MKSISLVLFASMALCVRAAEIPPYEPVGYDTGMRDAATGFFRVKNCDDGRWWVIDPVGRGVVLLGVDHVTYRGHWCEKTQKFHHLEEMKKKFPNEEDWRKDTISRLRKWGFNLLGAGSSEDLKHRGLVHTIFLSTGDEWAYSKDENLWICPNEDRPCSAFPNVFHPDWRKHCDDVAQRKCAPNRDDPWLFGYFIDNELAWWGRSHEWGTSATGLFDEAMKRKEGHPAREAALAMAKAAGVKDGESVPTEVKLNFLRRAAELYFEGASSAIRRADPNHVVMGARFAGISGAHPEVWRVSGKYCDLVTFNCYPWADLDRNVVLNDAWSRKEPVVDAFARVYSWVQKPLLVTEWSFPALDSGLPCTQGAGQRFLTQRDRTAATELFAKTMLALPYLLGYDYFMWVDEPALGISKAFPENTNYGLINEKGVAYPEITGMFENLHRNLSKWRAAGVPAVRDVKEERFDAAMALAHEMKEPTAKVYEDGASYKMCGSSGIVLEGRVGGANLFERTAIGEAEFGRFTLMVSFPSEGRTYWCDLRRVEKFERLADDRVRLTARGEDGGCAFTAEVEISLVPGKTKYIAELKKLTNVGTKPLTVERILFRQYASFMEESIPVEEVPTLWHAPSRGVWIAPDGRYCGAYAWSSLTRSFYYYRDGSGVHPDALFQASADGSPRVLGPGASWSPAGEVYIVGCLGFGGSTGWRQAASLRK